MDGYTLLERIGSGAYSTVFKAVEKGSGALVAVKELLSATSWAEAQALPEVVAARALPAHEGLLRLRALHRVGSRVFLVMDLCEGSLLEALAARGGGGGLPEAQVRFVVRRLLAALAALHGAGFMHRDVKPENVLLLAGGGGRPVLADFGQLRGGGGGGPLTPYVSTRWYRAPEVLLRAPAYGPAVDVWAAGALMAELLAGRPVFPGSSEADQLFRLCAALGPPPASEWPEAGALAAAAGVPLRADVVPRGVAAMLPFGTSPAAVAAVAALLTWSPARRPTAAGALGGLAFFATASPEAPLASAGGASGGDAARARADAVARQAALEAEAAQEGKQADAAEAEEGKEGGGKRAEGGARVAPRGATGSDDDSSGEEGAGGAPGAAGRRTQSLAAPARAAVARGAPELAPALAAAPAAPPPQGGAYSGAARAGKEADSDSGSDSGSDSEGGGYMPSFG